MQDTQAGNISEIPGSHGSADSRIDTDMNTMLHCEGTCTGVPDTVLLAVYESVSLVDNAPNGDGIGDAPNPPREQRTETIALAMAADGWRFCPCYLAGQTPAHRLVYGLVMTEMANTMADKLAAVTKEEMAQAATAAA